MALSIKDEENKEIKQREYFLNNQTPNSKQVIRQIASTFFLKQYPKQVNIPTTHLSNNSWVTSVDKNGRKFLFIEA